MNGHLWCNVAGRLEIVDPYLLLVTFRTLRSDTRNDYDFRIEFHPLMG